MIRCEDAYCATFASYPVMQKYHQDQSKESTWQRCRVKNLRIEPLDANSALFANPSAFAPGTSERAVKDTADNLGLAMKVNGKIYPIRCTAYKSLLDRAKINGTALPKLTRKELAGVLNACLSLFSSEALLLIRDEKIAAVHSGNKTQYSILPIDQLLHTIEKKLDDRFPGNVFQEGYTDHYLSTATWTLPEQKEELLGTYSRMLATSGFSSMSTKLVPGIRFMTSDTGVASAKVSAMLTGGQHSIHIGGCISVDHRYQMSIKDFETELDQLFAQFCDSVAKLQNLMTIDLEYPVNAMTRICKKLALPKKEATEAISMFQMAYGDGPATAHDVFLALQEVPYLMKAHHMPAAKILSEEENMARVLSLKWNDYDLARPVNY